MRESSVENETFSDLLALNKVYFWILLEIFESVRERDLEYWNVL